MRPTKGASGYLLDTNVIIHSALAPERLGKQTRRILTENPNVFFSPISITEFEIKKLKRKVPALPNLQQDLLDQDFQEKPFTSRHATEIRNFATLADHDPYDRMLLAQASVENLTLITADEKLLSFEFGWVIDSAN